MLMDASSHNISNWKRVFHEHRVPVTKNMAYIYVHKLSNNATIPTKGSLLSAGLDLYSAYDYMLPAHDRILVKTDLQICVPFGTYGRIAPRSGLALNNFIDVGAGVIDRDYTGNVGVILFNHSNSDFYIKKGDRIAQLICERIIHAEVKITPKMEDTSRGARGFGSTGVS